MSHVSQRKLKKKSFRRIADQLVRTISRLNSPRETECFLKELLTPTEQVMLAKRLSILFMLKHNVPFLYIEKMLKITPDTIARYQKRSKQKLYKTIAKNIMHKGAQQEFWNELQELFVLGMQSYFSSAARRGLIQRAQNVRSIWKTVQKYRERKKVKNTKTRRSRPYTPHQ